MARFDPPPVTAKITCDGCGISVNIAHKSGNAPEGWGMVTLKQVKPRTVPTRQEISIPGNLVVTTPDREYCSKCYQQIGDYLNDMRASLSTA